MDQAKLLGIFTASMVGLCSTAASGQTFEIVVDRTLVDIGIPTDGIVNFSLFADTQGSTAGFLASFTGWAGFSGTFSSSGLGIFTTPAPESGLAGDTANGGDFANWFAGRRAPFFFGVPGGAAGGFRFQPLSYEGGEGFLRGAGNTLIEGIAASSALGGFSQDVSSRLELFRGSIDYSGVANPYFISKITFNFATSDVFIDSLHNTVRSVSAEMGSASAIIQVVPASSPILLLGMGGIAAGRKIRHRSRQES